MQKHVERFRRQGGLSWLETSVIILVPWLIFVGICALFIFLMFVLQWVVWLVIVALLVISVAIVGVSDQQRKTEEANGRPKPSPWKAYAGALTLLAVVVSGTISTMTYDDFLVHYWTCSESHSYVNVMPSEHAAGYSDAGKILFARDTHVDSSRSLGYQDGQVYCVAPILDDSHATKVEFWAVGRDCCAQRGNFVCDDAWDPEARAGFVITNAPSFLRGGLHDKYTKAVAQAEAFYGMTSAEEPIFVRWVVNPEQVQNNFWHMGFGLLLVSSAIYLLISILLGLAAYYVDVY
eukprot:gnl/TRDRNA2_/TRDRNA2_185784_c0_seq1.p1 gnl/TRDRNA2_/TRDRNA2_185784_c0~~gnl/TRDRNA2_/TRDRNA2_185784_c0_seq1.p1  ORF type:complete len:292 (+),score=42.77 gnl/TRDRNA2_/TRDRNA2_185784_c0_seq1:170-1045(+)